VLDLATGQSPAAPAVAAVVDVVVVETFIVLTAYLSGGLPPTPPAAASTDLATTSSAWPGRARLLLPRPAAVKDEGLACRRCRWLLPRAGFM
jgi:hypothetical protein